MTDDLVELSRAFRLHAAKHGEGSESGNYRMTNRHYRKLVPILKGIRRMGAKGEEVLLILLDDENLAVRGWAATYSLSFAEPRARQVLADIASRQGAVALDATIVLQEWDKGTLRLL